MAIRLSNTLYLVGRVWDPGANPRPARITEARAGALSASIASNSW